jgi:hypothetical protein
MLLRVTHPRPLSHVTEYFVGYSFVWKEGRYVLTVENDASISKVNTMIINSLPLAPCPLLFKLTLAIEIADA